MKSAKSLNAVTLTCCPAFLAPLCMMRICNARHWKVQVYEYVEICKYWRYDKRLRDGPMSEAPFNTHVDNNNNVHDQCQKSPVLLLN